MVHQGLREAYEQGIKVWLYIRTHVISGWVTAIDDENIELTRLPNDSTTRERYIIRTERIDFISIGEVEEWSVQRLNKLLES